MATISTNMFSAAVACLLWATAGAQPDFGRLPPPEVQPNWSEALWLDDEPGEVYVDNQVQRHPNQWRQPSRHRGGQSMYVDVRVVRRPPVVPRVVRTPRPSPMHIWVAGEYFWRGGRYMYAPGAWVIPPQRGMRYIPGQWRPVRGGFVWVAGYWSGGAWGRHPQWR